MTPGKETLIQITFSLALTLGWRLILPLPILVKVILATLCIGVVQQNLITTLFFFRWRLNLEQGPQTIVLDTHKIEIPGHPHAYNGSLVRWKDQFLLSFRESTPQRRHSRNYLVWLDDNFTPTSAAHWLPLPPEAEDVRLIANDSHLYLVYTHAGDWISVGQVNYQDNLFSLQKLHELKEFEGKLLNKMEKNWTPFIAQNELYLSYSLQPHRVLTKTGTELSQTNSFIQWNWGEMRGGTPAISIDDHRYLALFHSQQMMSSVHSKGMSTLHYFIGAYTFSAQAPYKILAVSSKPIVAKGFYTGSAYPSKTRTPVNVVYPCGLVTDDTHLWFSYGRQDHELWIAKLDKQQLLDSLNTAFIS